MTTRSKKDPAPHVGIPLGPHMEEYLVKPEFDGDGVQVSSGIGIDGREHPDPVPMSPPIGYVPPSDVMVMLEQLFQRGQAVLRAAEIETEEEANDFDIEDDPMDPLTEYEKVFQPPAASPAAALSSTPVVSPGPQNAGSSGDGSSDKGVASQDQTPPKGS